MRSLYVTVVVGLVGVVVLTGCRKSEWTKKEVVDWYESYKLGIRGGLGYKGSDQRHHHFIARSMDTWVFIKIKREDLTLSDERQLSRVSYDPTAHYAVDPSRGFEKMDRGRDGAANVQHLIAVTKLTMITNRPFATFQRNAAENEPIVANGLGVVTTKF